MYFVSCYQWQIKNSGEERPDKEKYNQNHSNTINTIIEAIYDGKRLHILPLSPSVIVQKHRSSSMTAFSIKEVLLNTKNSHVSKSFSYADIGTCCWCHIMCPSFLRSSLDDYSNWHKYSKTLRYTLKVPYLNILSIFARKFEWNLWKFLTR